MNRWKRRTGTQKPKWYRCMRVARITLSQLAKRTGTKPPKLIRVGGHLALGRCGVFRMYLYPPALRNAWITRGVVAHEFGHWHGRHVLKNIACVALGTMTAMAAVQILGAFWRFIGWPLIIATLVAVNRFRILNEDEADAFARSASRYATHKLEKRWNSGGDAIRGNLERIGRALPMPFRALFRAFVGLWPASSKPIRRSSSDT